MRTEKETVSKNIAMNTTMIVTATVTMMTVTTSQAMTVMLIESACKRTYVTRSFGIANPNYDIDQYESLIESLNQKRGEAIATFNAGNRVKGYLIFKILSEEASKVGMIFIRLLRLTFVQSAFDRNGDVDEIDPRPPPDEWIQLTSALLNDCATKLTPGDWIAVKVDLEKYAGKVFDFEANASLDPRNRSSRRRIISLC